ncbi:hypothetical protein EJ04DRAFT_99670 [Polyplosphaeria fusca]|uniref:Uncharacterized protein n=1 Tax=Polyplosphaeria fusca TaxID=682080 RepID=A0A9P4UWY4_9PLEO|nr:hypothetical protein EJ04DRAFT_99670 [Polyplosphaeria fusca]
MSRHPRDTAARRPSISSVPEMTILAAPLAADQVPCGQFVTKSTRLVSSTLEDRDYDDIGTRWYKDVIVIDAASGSFLESLGGGHLVQKKLDAGTEAGTIEAEQMHVRMLKDNDAALKKALEDDQVKKAVEDAQAKGDDVGFVACVRQVINPSYKRARLVDVGLGNFEVIREVGGEAADGKRRDSGLDVVTGSKTDAVAVVVLKVEGKGSDVKLGEQLGAGFWA